MEGGAKNTQPWIAAQLLLAGTRTNEEKDLSFILLNPYYFMVATPCCRESACAVLFAVLLGLVQFYVVMFCCLEEF